MINMAARMNPRLKRRPIKIKRGRSTTTIELPKEEYDKFVEYAENRNLPIKESKLSEMNKKYGAERLNKRPKQKQ